MKLKTFKVVGVWGFLTKEISFRDHTTFLIGINGSGKTTILKLLDGLLKPNLKNLLFIDFKEISIIFSGDDSSLDVSKIVCKKYNDRMVILFHKPYKHIYSEHRVNFDGIEFPTKHIEHSDYERMYYFFQKSEVYGLIKELPTPVIVGLNRLLTDEEDDEHMPVFHPSMRNSIPLSLVDQNDDISEALKQVRDLIYDHIRENARKQSTLADEFKNQVFDEMLTPPQNSDLSHSNSNDYLKVKELKELLNDKIVVKETKQLTNKIKEYLSEYQAVIDEFRKADFNKLMDSAGKEQMILRKMLAFNAQFDKIYRVGRIAINNMKQIENLHAPINRFEKSVNLFFNEGLKEIKVGGSGDLYIINRNLGADINQSIFDLSSCEKQIIILIAYLSFKSSSKIFIVDEPEVSLHVSWQEKFVDALMEASPDNQFVLATHAPSIIARSNRRTWCEDLSK